MRESPPVPVFRASGAAARGRTMGDPTTLTNHRLAIIIILAFGTAGWRHAAVFTGSGSLATHLPYVLLDVLLAIPAAGVACWLGELLGRRIGLAGRTDTWEPVIQAAAVAVAFATVSVPLAIGQALGGTVLGDTAPAATLGYGLSQALQIEPVALVLALFGTAAVSVSPAVLWRESVIPRLRTVVSPVWALTIVVSAVTGIGLSTTPASAAETTTTGTGGCATAPQRTYDVHAINVDITVDRFGDHDPFGYMYVLADHEDEVRAQEAALQAASALELNDPAATKVSVGLGEDPIQPLVLRARLGECVVINFTNGLQNAPRGGGGSPTVVQPGGVPAVSIDVSGVAYDAAAGEGGQAVGTDPASALVAPGGSRQYKFYLDPLMGAGAKVFRSGGESTQLTAHGLFGAIVAEPAGARWYDPVSGAEKTGDATWSDWEAMIQPPGSTVFREFAIIYHELGDETFNLRRPLRENDEGAVAGDQAQFGRPLPMIDTGAVNPTTPTAGGGATNSYRPGSRAINYRSEPFYRRLQLDAARGTNAMRANESVAYSSYSYGDPATPMPRSYLGEPTITRLMDAGFEQLHVHHLHGGGTRWAQNPDADDISLGGGLNKTPLVSTGSIRLDSQTIGPNESYNLEHECGAGGCQQVAGDFLYHCHIAHHYVAGMWGLWRVFDTRQADLAVLPGQVAPPAAVNSAGLLGRKLTDGRTVVLAANLTNPATQVSLEGLVEGQLPPQGGRWDTSGTPDPDDATVWDWQRGGTATAPVYLGEPETTASWANYTSPTPGARPEVLFNPVTGKAAYPMLRPHLGMRPPFSPNGHSGAPYLGDTASAQKPDGLCPQNSPVRGYDVTAIAVGIQETTRERDANGELYVLNEDKDAVLAGTKPADPLTIRSNVGDCVAITFGSELNPAVQQKVNMHTHFVQFDVRASDGVIAGYAYEQSVFSTAREARTLTTVDSPTQITVSAIGELRTGVSIGVGVGRASIEVRKIVTISGNQLTFDSALTKTHAAGEPVTVEFAQYRWYSDADSGTVFWHDHVDGLESWAHGLFGAHIIEPRGSTYRDPTTGAPARSGTMVDIVNTSGSVGVGQSGSFREFMIFLHNGRRGRNELTAASGGGLNAFNFGQECEEGTINLRASPVGERTPGGATPADPTTTDQRQEYNGVRCRNAFSNSSVNASNAAADTVGATVSTVDPYVFSSVKYGDPNTPLLRAYVGDPVVIRTIGIGEREEALRIQGHRFRMERFNADGQLMDAATTGVSERFDYVLDGGAGGPGGTAGDYLYYSTRNFALESGAWGIFRVHDKLRTDLQPLPGRAAPPSGAGFPVLTAATGNTQQNPGANPPSAFNADGTLNTATVSSVRSPCPTGARPLGYDVSIFNQTLPTAPFTDTGGVIYALSSDRAAIQSGQKAVEPLVLRANDGDCVTVTLHNDTATGSLYGGTRAGLDLGKLLLNQQVSAGTAVGLNPDSTVPIGQAVKYTFYADQQLGTAVFQNLGSVASTRHGAYGLLVVEPRNSTWNASADNSPLGATATSSQAVIRVPGGQRFREFALTLQTTDQQYARSIIPYIDQVAGNGINSTIAADVPAAPVPGAPPGTTNNAGSYDKGFTNVSYHSAPLTQRLGLTANKDNFDQATVVGSYGEAFSSATYGDPATPVFAAYAGDPVVFRVGVGASDQVHTFTVAGHVFPMEPNMWSDPTDHRSQLLTARSIAAGESLDVKLVGGAGGPGHYAGDYLYSDSRQPFTAAGLWGIFRVLPSGGSGPAVL
jgi:hypothetical protein